MKKIIIAIFLFLSFFAYANTNYKLEKWSLDLVKKYNFSTKNLWKEISRKEFLETLFVWYKDYKLQKWIKINYNNYKKIDNKKYFLDVDLNSNFWKKLNYFAWIGAFSKRKYFYINAKLSQKDFFIVMKRLKILYSLKNCKYNKICEKEATLKNYFLKWTYYKYVSKILNKKLRFYYNSPKKYIQNWYKPFLNPNYKFPLERQSLNSCYAFSAKSILKFKNNKNISVSKSEKSIWKKASLLWSPFFMQKFDNFNHIKKANFYDIDTLISSLQSWEPISISYNLKYYSWKEKKYKFVAHIVTAYSFDEKWIWVSETVSNRRIRLPWNKIFLKNWKVRYKRMFKFYLKK